MVEVAAAVGAGAAVVAAVGAVVAVVAAAVIPAITIAMAPATGTTLGSDGSLTTNLNVLSKMIVTVSSEMGFEGSVDLALTTPGSDWHVALDNSTLTLTADGMATANLSIEADGDVTALTGPISIAASGTGVTSETAMLTTTFNPVLEVEWTIDANGQGVYDQTHLMNNPYVLTQGRSLSVFNCTVADTVGGHCSQLTAGVTATQLVVHSDATVTGFPHEQNTTAPATTTTAAKAYTVTPGKGTEEFYWHNNDNLNAAQHPFITIQ